MTSPVARGRERDVGSVWEPKPGWDDMCARCQVSGAGQEVHHRFREWCEIARSPAGDEVAVDHDGFIRPEAAGVFEVVLDSARAGDAFAFQDFRRDRDPAAMTDECDQLALFEEFPRP